MADCKYHEVIVFIVIQVSFLNIIYLCISYFIAFIPKFQELINDLFYFDYICFIKYLSENKI